MNLCSAVAVFAIISSIGQSNGAVLANYEIDGDLTAAQQPSAVDSAISASNIVSATTGGGPGNFSVSGSSNTAFLQYSQSAADLAGAITEEDYLQVTVSVLGGETVSFSDLGMTFRTDNASVTTSISLLVSLDGFATDGDIIDTFSVSSSTPSTVTYDLSGLSSLQDIDGPQDVTFRLYGYDDGGAAGSYGRVERFGINGTVIPEPSVAMLGAAPIPLGLLLRRR